MGHLLFIVMHVTALFVTIPLHLVYAVAAGRRVAGPSLSTHVPCLWCKELAHREASICPHCRQSLVPEREQIAQARAARKASGKRWWQPLG